MVVIWNWDDLEGIWNDWKMGWYYRKLEVFVYINVIIRY